GMKKRCVLCELCIAIAEKRTGRCAKNSESYFGKAYRQAQDARSSSGAQGDHAGEDLTAGFFAEEEE
ncbi:MAG TPA: hypothetical protein PLD93_02755, partial [Synergistaceae bacterium]|nr:hypothetical protein [Synergistaceae bacterium]